MTEAEFKKLVEEGKIEEVKKEIVERAKEEIDKNLAVLGITLEDFTPFLEILRRVKQHGSSVPTYTPKSFLEQFYLYENGTDRRLYVYINRTWVALSTPITDHGLLSGLNDNDHGAIYYTEAEIDALFAALETTKFGGTGADGDKTISADEELTTYKIYNYDDLTINAGKILSFGANFQNKIIIIKVKGNCVINGKIDLAGMGGQGDYVYHAGTASANGGTKNVTGSGTSWTSSMIGKVFCFGSESANNEAKTITAVGSATSLTVDTNFAHTHSAVKYYIALVALGEHGTNGLGSWIIDSENDKYNYGDTGSETTNNTCGPGGGGGSHQFKGGAGETRGTRIGGTAGEILIGFDGFVTHTNKAVFICCGSGGASGGLGKYNTYTDGCMGGGGNGGGALYLEVKGNLTFGADAEIECFWG